MTAINAMNDLGLEIFRLPTGIDVLADHVHTEHSTNTEEGDRLLWLIDVAREKAHALNAAFSDIQLTKQAKAGLKFQTRSVFYPASFVGRLFPCQKWGKIAGKIGFRFWKSD